MFYRTLARRGILLAHEKATDDTYYGIKSSKQSLNPSTGPGGNGGAFVCVV
jgi:hypothetical protein